MNYSLPYQHEVFAHHELELLVDAPNVKIFKFARPNDSNYHVYLHFAPCGITIMGDLRIGPTGCPVAYSYGLNWFVMKMDEPYLAEKSMVPPRAPGEKSEKGKQWRSDAGWLCALQQAFKKRFEELVKGGMVLQ